MLKSMGDRTQPFGTPDLNWRFVDEWFIECVCRGMLMCVSLSINVCMFIVSNTLLMSNATAIVRVGGMGWLKPVATVLLMLCSAVLVECLVLNPCCVVMFGMLCVIYGRITFSNVFAITDRRDIGLYDVPALMSLLGLGTGMMLANFNTCCCCCCSPSETYGGKWGDSNFQILTDLPVPPQAAGVVGIF